MRSSGNAQPARAPEPSGQTSAARRSMREAFGVAMKCFAVREQPVRKQQRLSVLHDAWCRAWECRDCARPGRRWREASNASAPRTSRDRILYVHAKLGRNHFVAAAAGVKLCAERPELFDQRGFREVMNVFGLRIIEPRGVRLCAELDFIERRDDLLAFFVRQDSRRGNGARPGAIERKLLRQQPAVEMPGTLELVEGSVGRAVETPAPHFLVFGTRHFAWASTRNSDREREEIDEAFGVFRVVAGHREAGEIRCGRASRASGAMRR